MKVLPILFCYSDVKDLYPNVNAFYAFAFRACKKGEIKQIKKGLYALVDRSTGMIYASKFQIASKLFGDAYFSYHEALEYYGLGTQSFVSRFGYLTHFYASDLAFEDIVYAAKKSPSSLQINDRIAEEGVRVVALERAIVDSIDCLSLSGGIEEVGHALEDCPDLDLEAVAELLECYNKSFLYQKVGYLLEKYGKVGVHDPFYELCLSRIGKKVRYLEPNRPNQKLNSTWRLMVGKNADC